MDKLFCQKNYVPFQIKSHRIEMSFLLSFEFSRTAKHKNLTFPLKRRCYFTPISCICGQSCSLTISPFPQDILAQLRRSQAPAPAVHCILPTAKLHNIVTAMIYVRLRARTLLHHAIHLLPPQPITKNGYVKVSCRRRQLVEVVVHTVNFPISFWQLTCPKRPSLFLKIANRFVQLHCIR